MSAKLLHMPNNETPFELMARAEGDAKKMGLDAAVIYGAALMRAGMRLSKQPDATAFFEDKEGVEVVAACVVLTESSAPILRQIAGVYRLLDKREGSAEGKLRGIKAILDASLDRSRH
jgi:hypothetical protein